MLFSVLSLLLLNLLVVAYIYGVGNQQEQSRSTRYSELAEARDALIDYSVNYPSHYGARGSGPGHLPCPDANGNGSPEGRCAAGAIGLLPVDFRAGGYRHVNLSLGQSRESAPVWYVLSDAFRYNPGPTGSPDSATIINSQSVGDLVLDGEEHIIALLIAPGAPTAGQQRDDQQRIADYLEGENADDDRVFSSNAGNDLVLALRWGDLMPLVERRVLATVQKSLTDYRAAHGFFPWLSAIDGTPFSTEEDGETACEPCTYRGILPVERYRRGQSWPINSNKTCELDDQTIQQPNVQLPEWFAKNYWHRVVWIHARGDSRDNQCEETAAPIVDGEAVSALIVSTGAPLQEPAHQQGPQLRTDAPQLSDYLDKEEWLFAAGEYTTFWPQQGVNDQWIVLP